MEIVKTKTTFILLVLKVVFQVVLVFSVSNFFVNKNSQGSKLSGKKIPSSCKSALGAVARGPELKVFSLVKVRFDEAPSSYFVWSFVLWTKSQTANYSTLLLLNVYSDFWGSVFENFFEISTPRLSSIENDIFCQSLAI